MVVDVSPANSESDSHGGRAIQRAVLIRNPLSRSGGDDLTAAIELFRSRGILLTETDGRDRDALNAAIALADFVIVAGGDGTIHHAAPTLLAAGKPFGILPLGTANDLARSLDVPPDPLQAAQIILDGVTRSIDLGEVNGKPYFNVASLGVSVELAREMTRETKRRFGAFSYVVAGARALTRARRFRAVIEGNGRRARVRTFQIAVGNGRYYGGGMSVSENCRIGDGRLYLYSLEMQNLWKLALMAFDFRAGAHGAWEEVRADTGERFVVRTRRPRDINADGEIITQTPATFTIRRNALKVFAPPSPDV